MNQETLQTIQAADFPDTPEGRIYTDLQKQIGDITDGFTNPGNLSAQKVDVTELCKQEGVSPDDYKAYFGSLQRSEQDVAQNVADHAPSTADTPNPQPTGDKAKKLKLAKAKMKMAAARLKLMSI